MLLSLDISTSCIGYSVFNEKRNLIELDYIEFNSKHSKFEKLEAFKEKISHLLKMKITSIAIEEPLKKFKGKEPLPPPEKGFNPKTENIG